MKQKFQPIKWFVICFFGGVLAACARIDAVSTSVMTSTLNSVAVVNDQIVRGTLKLYPDRTGRVTLDAETPDDQGFIFSCMGRVRFLGTTNGVIDLRCNTGLASELTFSMLNEISGFAYGASTTGGVSLAFGLDDMQAKSYLQPPPQKRLVIQPETGLMQLQ
jgi:hypothetical protein